MKNFTRLFVSFCYLTLSISLVGCKDENSNTLPILETINVTEITAKTAKSGGIITSDGNGEISSRGVCWNIASSPTLADYKTIDGAGKGSFESFIINLLSETTYYLRAYATNNNGTSYGNEVTFTTAYSSSSDKSQIIADHNAVAEFDKIPAQYITEVKKMSIALPGESHSVAMRKGLELLKAQNSTYACNVAEGEAYTTSYLRVDYQFWIGEDYWFTWVPSRREPYTSHMKVNVIKAYADAGHPLRAFGFTWCADMNSSENGMSTIDPVFGVHWYGRSQGGPQGSSYWGLDTADKSLTGNDISLATYFAAMEEYISYCSTYSPTTTMVFTTGPVDATYGEFVGEQGYQGHLKHEAIREYVAANNDRVLFDVADILAYDNDGTPSTQTWNGHTYPVLTTTNKGDESIGHIGSVGAIRLAKAQWWLLARIAGWDGN